MRIHAIRMAALGITALATFQAHASEKNELICWFDRGKLGECTAFVRECPEERAPGYCRPRYEVNCGGYELISESDYLLYDTQQSGGLGITMVGEKDGGFPHLLIDAPLARDFEGVIGQLYLSPEERLAGFCSNEHRSYPGGTR